uniref:NADH dehydrogenase flavoprotein 3, mitochondrial n=1 Tax=Salmo salar TaxID=8030 RepID=C0H7Q3_SALSA|nr:NADH dehydrogenase flavoprotein 3, mitochondrial precursor [Salmo salar]ACN12419.1 NADH dehydrogenase flavoprotein 3, mitochondrial precursor [Salmo salar]
MLSGDMGPEFLAVSVPWGGSTRGGLGQTVLGHLQVQVCEGVMVVVVVLEVLVSAVVEDNFVQKSWPTFLYKGVPDNSTYKNLQHHNYNHYTFADLDLEMAKYRLPQPSSGRPSPRH